MLGDGDTAAVCVPEGGSSIVFFLLSLFGIFVAFVLVVM